MRGLGIIIYGIEGIGKTTFCLEAPKPLGIMSIRETGYDDLEMIGAIPEGVTPIRAENWEELMIAVKACQMKTLVIDAISGMQEYLVRHVTATDYYGNFSKFKSFYNGLRQDCPKYVAELLDEIEIIRNKGVHVFFIAHRQNETDPDSGGADTKVQGVFGDEGVTGPIKKWAQATLFLSGKKDVSVVTKSAGRGNDATILEGKSFGKPTRLMYTQLTGYHLAKNKLNLPPVISMGNSPQEAWKNFVAELPEPIRKNMG